MGYEGMMNTVLVADESDERHSSGKYGCAL